MATVLLENGHFSLPLGISFDGRWNKIPLTRGISAVTRAAAHHALRNSLYSFATHKLYVLALRTPDRYNFTTGLKVKGINIGVNETG